MRVLFVTHNYPRFEGDVAGNFLHPLAQALVGRGHDVRVIAPSDMGHGGDTVLDGVPVHRVRYASASDEILAYRGTMAAAVRSPRGLRALASLVRGLSRATRELHDGHADTIVHAHWWFPAALALPRRMSTVVTCHGTDLRLLDTSRAVRMLGRHVLGRMHRVTTVSRYLANIVMKRIGREIPDGDIQPMPIVQVPRPRSTGGGGIVLVGRLAPQKRVDLALRGIAAAGGATAALPVTVVGSGPEHEQLEALGAALGMTGRLSFVGSVSGREIPRFFERADVCVMTAYQEGLGLAAAEAMIQGVPVVACTDGGGVLDVVPASGGGRIVAPVPGKIAAGLEEIVGDVGERDSAFARGAMWASRLTPDAAADACERWYEGVRGE